MPVQPGVGDQRQDPADRLPQDRDVLERLTGREVCVPAETLMPENDAHLPMGFGSSDFEPLFNYLKSNRNSPPVITLEPHCEKDLWLSLEYLSKKWPW